MKKWTRERYKNDPEWLELLRKEEREKQRDRYRRKKEKQKNGDTRICSDNNTAQR